MTKGQRIWVRASGTRTDQHEFNPQQVPVRGEWWPAVFLRQGRGTVECFVMTPTGSMTISAWPVGTPAAEWVYDPGEDEPKVGT